MRTLLLALVIALVAAAPAAARTRNVKIGDNFFVSAGQPSTVTVKKGTIVRWNWRGSHSHNVVVQKGPRHFTSELKSSGHFSKKLRRRGTYKIICSIHAPDMRMTLKVT
jgi:plastocyanin